MSQHDFDIANQTASNARADINNALKALASLSSGATAPSTTYANMLWYDTSNNTLKMRNEADDAWVSVGYLDQSSDAFRIFDDTQVVNSSGTQTGIIGDQTTGTWETGTVTTESLVSPAKVKAAVLAHAPSTSYTDAEARTAQSGHSVGDVGSYAWLSRTNSTGSVLLYNPGDTEGGSNLKYSGEGGAAGSPPSPSGTWQCMGFLSILNGSTASTLWLRIS